MYLVSVRSPVNCILTAVSRSGENGGAHSMPTDRELFDQEKEDQLRAQLTRRTELDVQAICARLVGMGRCIDTCPDGCQEFSEIGHELARKAVEKALKAPKWGDEGLLFVTVADDDFRRLWNTKRGLVMEVLQNKFLRTQPGTKAVTTYGKRFYKHACDHDVLKTFLVADDGSLFNEQEACRIFQSWLANLWDDACDNAEMSLSFAAEGSREKTYCHPSDILDDCFRRYGYRADRVHRRRTSVDNEREIDAVLPLEWRPQGRLDGVEESAKIPAYQEQLKKFAVICDALLEMVEKTDEDLERFGKITIPDETGDLESRLTKRNISFRVKDGEFEISRDDADRIDDGFVNASVFVDGSPPNNGKTLFDDFVEAWVLTRGTHRGDDTALSDRVVRYDQSGSDFQSDSDVDDAPSDQAETREEFITLDEYPSDEVP